MRTVTISFRIQADQLDGVTDEHLHALWYIAQANPAPYGDQEAGSLVFAITDEIVKRWLAHAPADRFNHQISDRYHLTLQRHGSWTGPAGEWVPHQRQQGQIAGACSPTTASHTTPTHPEV